MSKFSLAGALDYSAIVGESASSGFGSAAIAVDTEGSAYITGTGGTPWPTTTGAYATQLQNASNPAVFVTKLSPDGSKLSYSTFVGAGRLAGLSRLTPARTPMWLVSMTVAAAFR